MAGQILACVDPSPAGERACSAAIEMAVRFGRALTLVTVLPGSVFEALLAHLEQAPPDLVVVGTRGRSRGSRILLGSVSSRLVTEAPCPVLVVRTIRKPGVKAV
jgi:nucleotide-binding universal stress UspA family protein